MTTRFTKQRFELDPLFNAVTLASDRTATVNMAGYSQLTLFCTLVLDASTTGLILNVRSKHPEDSNYYAEVEEDVSSPPTVGVDITGGGRDYDLLAAGPDAGTYRFCMHIPVDADEVQLTLDQTGNNASSTFTAYAVKSVQ